MKIESSLISDNTLFQCPAGYSIPIALKCDGINNCGDNADEINCPKGEA